MEDMDNLLKGAHSFLRESQQRQEKLHDNADSLIYLRTAVKDLAQAMGQMWVLLQALPATPPASEARQPTTVGTTTTAPTQDSPSDVVLESTRRSILQPLRLDTKTEDAGPVELGSECAHIWLFPHLEIRDNWAYRAAPAQCMKCRASRSFDVTPVPAVGPDTSTSVRPASSPSVVTSPEESAPSPSSALTDGVTTEAGDTGEVASETWQRCPNRECIAAKGCCWIKCEVEISECKHVWVIEAERVPESMWAWKDPVMTVRCENCPATEELALLRYRRL